LFSAAATARDNSGPPVVTNAMYMQQGDFYVGFPSPEDFAVSRGFSTTFQSYVNEVTKLGGAIVSPNFVQMTLRGNIPGLAEISDIHVIKQCKAPLKYQSSAANISLQAVSGIDFDLDDVFPVAKIDDLGTLSGGFFTKHLISLADGQTQTLLVALTTQHYFCQFTLQLVVDTPTGATVIENVTDNGKPFAVTASALP
jgi:hypothetical protein